MNRNMQPPGAALEKIVIASVRRAPAEEAPVLAWPLTCGSAVAQRTRALKFREGVLQVEVADASWRSELQSLAPKYVATINRYVAQRVLRIEFVIRAS
jgi:predicted nucleic acid-binding Zn ribbon protein